MPIWLIVMAPGHRWENGSMGFNGRSWSLPSLDLALSSSPDISTGESGGRRSRSHPASSGRHPPYGKKEGTPENHPPRGHFLADDFRLGGALGSRDCVDPMRIHWTPRFVGTLLYNAVPGNVLAWLLWSYSLHHLPSGVAGMGTFLAPLVGVMASWGQLGERPGLFEGTGMARIFLAVNLKSQQRHRPKDQGAHRNRRRK
jgi:hypothetical protein